MFHFITFLENANKAIASNLANFKNQKIGASFAYSPELACYSCPAISPYKSHSKLIYKKIKIKSV